MIKTYLNWIFLFFYTFGLAQIDFEPGYFINNNGNKTECLIRNTDLKNSPRRLLYKLDTDSEIQEVSIAYVREFKIFDTDHYYKRYKLSDTEYWNDPKFIDSENDLIFLKVLIEGSASLLEYSLKKIYFYQIENQDLVLLKHSITVDKDNKVKEKLPFRKTLFDNLKCDTFSLQTFSNLNYKRKANL